MGYTPINITEITPKQLREFEDYLKMNGLFLESTAWELVVYGVSTMQRVAHAKSYKELFNDTGFNHYLSGCD